MEKIQPILDKIKVLLQKIKPLLSKVKPFLDKVKSVLVKGKDILVTAGKAIIHKIKNIDYNKIRMNIKKAIDYVIRYKRYFGAGVIFVAFVLMIIFGTGKEPFRGWNPAGNVEEGILAVNKYEDVNALINNYYTAYAEGDRELLSQYAEPISKNEADYIALFSGFIESVTVKNVYTYPGVKEGSYLVSVEMEYKFVGVETTAPGLDFFYVETGKEQKLYINNLYSQFNMQSHEYIRTNEEVLTAIYSYNELQELKDIQVRIEKDYMEAMAKDDALNEMVMVTVSRAISDWMSTIEIVVNQDPPQGNLGIQDAVSDDEQDNNQDAEGDNNGDENESPKQEILDVDVVEKVVTIDNTNVRDAASKEGNLIKTVPAGTELEVVGIDDWGGWTCVKIDGKNGYIRNDLIKTVETQHSVAGLPAYPKVGQMVLLISDQKAYVKMDDTTTVIATLKLGASVTVEMSYANGWSKVSWDNGMMVGYVPTAVLKLD